MFLYIVGCCGLLWGLFCFPCSHGNVPHTHTHTHTPTHIDTPSPALSVYYMVAWPTLRYLSASPLLDQWLHTMPPVLLDSACLTAPRHIIMQDVADAKSLWCTVNSEPAANTQLQATDCMQASHAAFYCMRSLKACSTRPYSLLTKCSLVLSTAERHSHHCVTGGPTS